MIRVFLADDHEIVLSMYPEEQHAPHLLESGAAACLSKAQLAGAVPRGGARGRVGRAVVVAGGRAHAAGAARGRAHAAAPHAVVAGAPDLHAAHRGPAGDRDRRAVEPDSSTISNHIHAIKTKLEARSVADIVMYAHRARV